MNNKNRYSPKESLGLLIIANENVSFKEMDNLVLSLEHVLSQEKSKSEILEKIDINLISQIENFWELKKSQVIAYGYLVFNHFRIQYFSHFPPYLLIFVISEYRYIEISKSRNIEKKERI